MGKLSDIFKCFRKKPQSTHQRAPITETRPPLQQRPSQTIRSVESAPNRSQPPDSVINTQPQNPIQQQLPAPSNEPKTKIAQVKITSTYDHSNLEVRDFRPEKIELLKFRFVCPICYRYFNHIFQTTCCKHYICKYCVDDMNHTANEKKLETLSCHLCKKPELAVTDVAFDATIKKYTDSAMMSPVGTINKKNRFSGTSDNNSPSKFSNTLSKKDAEKLKGATFNGYSNKNAYADFAVQGENKQNRGMSYTADWGMLAKNNNNKIREEWLSDRELAKSFEVALDDGDGHGGEEEEKSYGRRSDVIGQGYNSRGLQNFSGQNLASSQLSNNQEREVSEDSINQRQDVSVISEKVDEEMTASQDLRKNPEFQNQLSKSGRYVIYAEESRRIEDLSQRV